MQAKADRTSKHRPLFPKGTLKRLASSVLNGQLDVEKDQFKSAILSQYDTNEGASAFAEIAQVGFERGKSKGLSITIKNTQKYLDRLVSPDIDAAAVAKMYKALSIPEPADMALDAKIASLRALISERQSKALSDKSMLVSTKNKYESLSAEYNKTRSAVVKDWKVKYSTLSKKLKEVRDADPRLHQLRDAKKAASAEEKKGLAAEIKTIAKTLDDEFTSGLISVDTIAKYLGLSVDEAKRLVPVFELRGKITEINNSSVRVSHTGDFLSSVAEREVVELATCTKGAFLKRINEGSTVGKPTYEDLVEGMKSSTSPISAFFRSSPTYHKLLGGETVKFPEESKELKSFVTNTSKTVLKGFQNDVILAMAGIVYDSLVGLIKLFKNGAKTVSKATVISIVHVLLTSHGFDCCVFDDLIDAAFAVKVQAKKD